MFLKLIELYKIYQMLHPQRIPKNLKPISINIIVITLGLMLSNNVFY